jgi:aspartate-semialdehyde dehydrogenase
MNTPAPRIARRIDVGLLGATGVVGQQVVRLLAGHPWFSLTWLAASERSAGRPYADAVAWRLPTSMPDDIARLPVHECSPGRGPALVFSALDAAAAREIEPAFARTGHVVVSNARSHRTDPLVPLLIPEVNAEHLLGELREDAVSPHPVVVSAHTTRVPVVEGHTETISVALGHNTVRGAAGAAILNAELMMAEGLLGSD